MFQSSNLWSHVPGEPHDTVNVAEVKGIKIDSAFIGSCTNGRMTGYESCCSLYLKNRKVAPGVVLKIVPATDEIWKQCLDEGLIRIFKECRGTCFKCRLCRLCCRTGRTKWSGRSHCKYREQEFSRETGKRKCLSCFS